MLATTQLQAVADRGLVLAAPIPSVSEMPAPQVGTKCWHHSLDQGVPTPRQDKEEAANINDKPEECPCQKQKEGRLAAKALKEPQREAFSKESDILKVARQAYQKAHQVNFEQEGSCDLSSVFQQMTTSTNLLGTEVHEVQESWGGQNDPWAANWVVKASPKDIPHFWIISPT